VNPTEKWIAELQQVLKKLDSLDVTERDRKTLRRACSEAMVEAEDRLQSEYEHRNSSKKWAESDIQILEASLREAGPCKSWEAEQILLRSLAQRLGRPEKFVKTKAIELGHGAKVDYWINKS